MNTVTIRLKIKQNQMKQPLHQGNDTNLGRKRLNMHNKRSQCIFEFHAGQCRSALEGVFGLFASRFVKHRAAAVSGEARGFKVGVKGEGTGGVYPLPLGARPGLCPRKNFQSYRCMQVSFSAFSDKNQHIDACIYAGKLWYSPKPF
jgi:hypothetical protein